MESSAECYPTPRGGKSNKTADNLGRPDFTIAPPVPQIPQSEHVSPSQSQEFETPKGLKNSTPDKTPWYIKDGWGTTPTKGTPEHLGTIKDTPHVEHDTRARAKQSIFDRRGIPKNALVVESQGLKNGSYVVGDEKVAVKITPQQKE